MALFTVTLEQPEMGGPTGANHQPGQFVMLSAPGVGEAPFCLCHAASTHEDGVELCIRRVGEVTARLFDLPEGALLGLRGPLGSGFEMDDLVGGDLLLIAGGMGMAPLRSVLQAALTRRREIDRLILIDGARTMADLIFWPELAALPADVERLFALDDPSGARVEPLITGHVGMALAQVALDPNRVKVALCGPPVMLEPVVRGLEARGVSAEDIFITFERRMSCGVGHCGHCAMGRRYVCVDGPVFSAAAARELGEGLR
ncbi:putative oxidoreductase FAD-binding subunit [Magnetofaba australis IT-1]|uniref:Putative oxidoreductase FAD-binding subunit n=1 Tax=Magnetofaba australis IT-1 TaxID=1434232 RepID=A0A1Y2K790_9PROT|nr:putative oxidoreductase FAD-binding subunit [Magnetofaba australis IT-1]